MLYNDKYRETLRLAQGLTSETHEHFYAFISKISRMIEELESQVAKIEIGNFKNTNSYVYVLAEKAAGGPQELYLVAELPMLNPAAQESCEKICLAIGSTLKRAYKKAIAGSSFENAVAQINEELAKLAETGQTHWINKLNCSIAVKEHNTFNIATTGKVSAFLFRGDEFTDISCSAGQPHPLKTFENIASGKIRLGDLLILSTTQLFNYLSMDRLKDILTSNNFLTAAQLVIEVLKENAGPEVAFGTILNLQVQPGQTVDEEIDLEDYVMERPPVHLNVLNSIKTFVQNAIAPHKEKRAPSTDLPNIALSDKIKNLSGSTQNLWSKGKDAVTGAVKNLSQKNPTQALDRLKGFSKYKKLLLGSIVLLFCAVVATIYVSVWRNKTDEALVKAQNQITEVKSLISRASDSLLYQDETSARELLSEAEGKLPQEDSVPQQARAAYQEAKTSIQEVKDRMEKSVEVTVASLGNVGQADVLLSLPSYLATQVGSNIVSYNRQTGAIEDGVLKASEHFEDFAFARGSFAVVHNGQGLLVWDFSRSIFGPLFTQNVPVGEDFAGLAYYPTNSRVYTVNKKTNQIINYVVGDRQLSRPTVSSREANNLSGSLDLAVDGSIYVLNTSGVTKYYAGTLAEFNFPALYKPFSGKGKIATAADFKNLYVLDSGNNRIIVMDKRGNLLQTLTSPEFKDLRDFEVDEKNKIIYLLSGGNLLKASIP